MNVFSLGGYCQVSERIRRRFGYLRPSPFDWLVTPIDVSTRIIIERGDRFAQSVTRSDDRDTVICDAYRNTLYHHEFERDADYRVIFADPASEMLIARAKLLEKMHRFISAISSEPAVLVRLGTWASHRMPYPYFREDDAIAHSDLNALAQTVRTHAPRFRILHIHHSDIWQPIKPDAPLDASMSIIDLPAPYGDWIGDDTQWDMIFERVAELNASLT